jgi:hypothetical protein
VTVALEAELYCEYLVGEHGRTCAEILGLSPWKTTALNTKSVMFWPVLYLPSAVHVDAEVNTSHGGTADYAR